MVVFRITLTKYTDALLASGRPARWNGKGTFMVYTAGSVALACLENLAHRAGVDVTLADFSLMEIIIPDPLETTEIKARFLENRHPDWHHVRRYPFTQELGNQWIKTSETPVLKVPSAIIKTEHNYLINPHHPDFANIKIKSVSPFSFDHRIL